MSFSAYHLLGKLLLRSFLFETLSSIKMAFTSVDEIQTALKACVSVQDWEMLINSTQIPEVLVPMAYARLSELTVQELEVSLIAPFTGNSTFSSVLFLDLIVCGFFMLRLVGITVFILLRSRL